MTFQTKRSQTFDLFNPFHWSVWILILGTNVVFALLYCMIEWKSSKHDSTGRKILDYIWFCAQKCLRQCKYIDLVMYLCKYTKSQGLPLKKCDISFYLHMLCLGIFEILRNPKHNIPPGYSILSDG